MILFYSAENTWDFCHSPLFPAPPPPFAPPLLSLIWVLRRRACLPACLVGSVPRRSKVGRGGWGGGAPGAGQSGGFIHRIPPHKERAGGRAGGFAESQSPCLSQITGQRVSLPPRQSSRRWSSCRCSAVQLWHPPWRGAGRAAAQSNAEEQKNGRAGSCNDGARSSGGVVPRLPPLSAASFPGRCSPRWATAAGGS